MATNVLMSALIARGVCTDLFEYVIRQHELVTSEYILNELFQHLINKFKFELAEAQEVLELLRSRTKVVLPIALGTPVCRDPDDDPVLGTAVAGQVTCIVTGDQDLLVLKRFESIDIVSPSEFSDYEAAKES